MAEQFGEFIAKLTDNARISLQHAEAIARGNASPYIGTEHMLLGVLAQGSSVGAKLLADAGVTLDRLEGAMHMTSHVPFSVSTKMTTLSETALLTLKMAYEQALELHQEFLGTEHILYSILRQKGARGTVLLRDMDIDINQIVDEIEAYFEKQGSDYEESIADSDSAQPKRIKGILDRFGTDLTAQAAAGELDAVIGREKEEERIVTILSRRTKNNPVLIGEPGVGKTAIVEGLAQRIVAETVPDYLIDMKVIQLDLAGMVAGTKYRGEFEERLQQVVAEVTRRDDVILFIDELHLLVGAGAAEGAMDAANILKPALARGKFRLIGATTLDEYRKNIEKDAALERRFQEVVVNAPSVEDTRQIVRGLRDYYEKHHGVSISDEVIDNAVYMADRYISNRQMPDKAIDVIDEASALARIASTGSSRIARKLRQEIKLLNEKIEAAVASEAYEKAALYKVRLSQASSQLESGFGGDAEQRTQLTESHVAKAIASMTGIPVEKVHSSERARLKNLERHLSQSVIGQQEAIETVSRSIRRGRSGVASGTRPIGSFIFLGSTGVGKTELARVLADEVFGSRDALVKIDMSEFSERHSTSRLVGAPAGYVGYEDGGKLTDKIRRQPYSVVLFDEIEKAHPDVMTILLQILEDGVLTDAHGRSVSFANTIVILTSNLGSQAMQRADDLGFVPRGKNKSHVEMSHQRNSRVAREALGKFMRPELINRFDDIVTFRPLGRHEVGKIFDLLVNELRDRLHRQGYGLMITPQAKRWLIDRGFDEKHGARPLRRTIERYVEHPIAEAVLSDNLNKGSVFEVEAKQGEINVRVTSESEVVHAA